MRRGAMLLGLFMLISMSTRAAAAEPTGTITWGVHVTLATRWLDPADTDAEITPFMVMYALAPAASQPMLAPETAPPAPPQPPPTR